MRQGKLLWYALGLAIEGTTAKHWRRTITLPWRIAVGKSEHGTCS